MDHLLVGEVEQLVKLYATVGKGAKRSALLEVGSELRVSNFFVSLAHH